MRDDAGTRSGRTAAARPPDAAGPGSTRPPVHGERRGGQGDAGLDRAQCRASPRGRARRRRRRRRTRTSGGRGAGPPPAGRGPPGACPAASAARTPGSPIASPTTISGEAGPQPRVGQAGDDQPGAERRGSARAAGVGARRRRRRARCADAVEPPGSRRDRGNGHHRRDRRSAAAGRGRRAASGTPRRRSPATNGPSTPGQDPRRRQRREHLGRSRSGSARPIAT